MLAAGFCHRGKARIKEQNAKNTNQKAKMERGFAISDGRFRILDFRLWIWELVGEKEIGF